MVAVVIGFFRLVGKGQIGFFGGLKLRRCSRFQDGSLVGIWAPPEA